MPHQNLDDPLHGVTLKEILDRLVGKLGWEELASRVHIRCFHFEPTVTSSLRFLRRTPWARAKVEKAYLGLLRARARSGPAVREDGGADQPLKDDPNSPEDSD